MCMELTSFTGFRPSAFSHQLHRLLTEPLAAPGFHRRVFPCFVPVLQAAKGSTENPTAEVIHLTVFFFAAPLHWTGLDCPVLSSSMTAALSIEQQR